MKKIIVALRKFANAPKIGIGGDRVAQCIYNHILLVYCIFRALSPNPLEIKSNIFYILRDIPTYPSGVNSSSFTCWFFCLF
jgi:hypothetical protein